MRGTSSRWKSKYVALDVEQGVTRLDVTMTGTGDADLYVRKGRNPTVYVHNCKSVTADTSSETCSVAVSSPGTYFIRARTRTPGTVVSITAETVR
jgi:serine protease